MNLADFKRHLERNKAISFRTSDGTPVPEHFHLTEIGRVTKSFIDCGGTRRDETKVNFQFWEAGDYDHRLTAEKWRKLIALAQEQLDIEDDPSIEVEYQGTGETIGRYSLEEAGETLVLQPVPTACLALKKEPATGKEGCRSGKKSSCC